MKYGIRYKMAKTIKNLGINFDARECEAVHNMRDVIASLPGASIQFAISREPNGNWVAESINISGILTGGTAKDDAQEMIKDAIFTYFEIPARYCDDSIIRAVDKSITIKQEMLATV